MGRRHPKTINLTKKKETVPAELLSGRTTFSPRTYLSSSRTVAVAAAVVVVVVVVVVAVV